MVRLNRIYTRTGDAGTTGLVDGSRVSKADGRIAAIGDVDEANSQIGVAIAAMHAEGADGRLTRTLTRIQNDLFDLGADLATPAGGADGEGFEPSEMVLRVVPAQVTALEAAIDGLNADMEPLASFILPGGSGAAAALHVARAVVRRAERSAVAAADAVLLNPAALSYLNRLSDFLFVAARWVNQKAGIDVLWIPGGSR